MENIKNTFTLFEKTVNNLFDCNEWTSFQNKAYVKMKHIIENFQEDSKKYEIKDDKLIIRNNLKDQIWFTYSKTKPIISQLLDCMSLIHYIFNDSDFCTNFYLVISFGKFNLHACLYKNKINNFLNHYIFFENHKKIKAYLTYYHYSMGTSINEDLKKLKVPEFEKIYDVIGMSDQILSQYDLLNFFSEVIMYYDESQIIGDVQISHNFSLSLNQLTERYKIFIIKKNSENGYQKI